MAFRLHHSLLVLALAPCGASAQAPRTADTAAHPQLAPVTVKASQQAPLDIGGLGDAPLSATPISARVIDAAAIESAGARRLADLVRLDAAITDAYNAPGYWDFVSIRGFTLDNRFNYRRDGLPISAETSIPLDNKERIEILKGLSGLQAGVSTPGGLVNYVIKRPLSQPLRQARIEWSERASLLASADLGGRAGAAGAFGWRFNVAQEQLRPQTRSLDGSRSLAALATQWRLTPDTILDAEIEWSRKRQPSQQAFSLLGATLPGVPDPRLNLNNQAWSQASVFEALNASVRLDTALSADWRASVQWGTQRLRSDDRLAYAFGCSADGNFDRFCQDGTFDLYDFRSENERRHAHSGRVSLQGRVQTGAWEHQLGASLLVASRIERFQDQAFNWVGVGNVAGTERVDPDPRLTDVNTNRDERWLELALSDAIRISAADTIWLGARLTDLQRASQRTDGSRAARYSQSISTPWLAWTHQLAAGPLAYVSAGEGIESQIVPNKPSQYSNAGVALPALRSRQVEAGLRHAAGPWAWQVALFQVRRPMSNLDACNRLGLSPCTGQFDGQAVHRGVEAGVQWDRAAWQWNIGVMALHARREGSQIEPELNGKRIANVPAAVLRAQALWRVPGQPGLALRASLQHEGARDVVPGGSLRLPAWTRIDAGVDYEQRWGDHRLQWRVALDNVADRRYWRESPYQFGHVYLYPGAPRTLRVSLTTQF